jgi:hypothetical protein
MYLRKSSIDDQNSFYLLCTTESGGGGVEQFAIQDAFLQAEIIIRRTCSLCLDRANRRRRLAASNGSDC